MNKGDLPPPPDHIVGQVVLLPDPFTFGDFLAFIEAAAPDTTYQEAFAAFETIIMRGWYSPVAMNPDGTWLYEHTARDRRTFLFQSVREGSGPNPLQRPF